MNGVERLEYIIELGRKLPVIDKSFKIDSFKIHGCASNLWLVPKLEKTNLILLADAEAFITKGTAYIVLDCLSGEKIKDLISIERKHFAPLGITELMSIQRQNGLGLLIAKIQFYAKTFQSVL